jgi:hypothetical protein
MQEKYYFMKYGGGGFKLSVDIFYLQPAEKYTLELAPVFLY